jgi:Micrococcal nuclease (thermonuclease) homologs
MRTPFHLLLLAALAVAPIARAGDATADASTAKSTPTKARVVAAYDGDTLTLDTGDKVRLQWVNTPELKPAEDYGVEARDATRKLVLDKEVTLTYGPVTHDGYGRLIASVKVGDQDLASYLVEQGLAHVFLIPPLGGDVSGLLALQEKARAAHRGIWSTTRYQGALHITSFHPNAPGDDRQNPNGEYMRVCNVSSQPVDLQGYRITDLSGESWTFPSLIVPAGNTFEIHSGKGTNQPDPQSQLKVYLQSDGPVWNNERDRATIYDRYGKVVDSRGYSVKSHH